MVQHAIGARVIYTPFVNVICHYFFCSLECGHNTQYTGAASGIQYLLSAQVHGEQLLQNHVCGFVASGTECHFRVKLNFISGVWITIVSDALHGKF